MTRYTCTSCGAVLEPQEGDCCVFCSYADQHCAGVQKAYNNEGILKVFGIDHNNSG